MQSARCIAQTAGCILLLAAVVWAAPARPPLTHDVRPLPGVVTKQLSDYLPALAHTAGDTPVYVIQGTQPGGTVFVSGGTHGNEFAGIMTAILLVEHAGVQKGRLIVVPHANNAAMRLPAPRQRAWVTLRAESGVRRFRFGSRLTPVHDQGAPDAARYRHPQATVSIAGQEARNLDRVFPGRDEGTLTDRVAAAIVALMRTEHVDLAFDLHESGPGSKLSWTVMASGNAETMVRAARPALDREKLRPIAMPARPEFRGVSVREWAESAGVRAFLFETPSPAPTRRRPANEVGDPRLPLARRVAAHLAGIQALVDAFDVEVPVDRQIRLRDVPTPWDLSQPGGVGRFLR